MTIFDDYAKYAADENARIRLNARHQFCVEEVREFVEGKRVLDLASHDGRWAYSYAAAGAAEVVGVEGRQELVDEFADYPDTDAKSRVTLHQGDALTFMERLVAQGETFDVVANLGFFYHTMEHFRFMKLARALDPDLIIIDSEFMIKDNPIIQITIEDTKQASNAIADYDGQDRTVIGIASTKAVEKMAEVIGYDLNWADWSQLPKDQRNLLGEYFRNHRKQRRTAYLTRPNMFLTPDR